MTWRVLLLIITFSTQLILGQEKFTLSGTIKDSTDGEDLIGVYVTVANLTGVGTITNSYGFYSITLPQGEYTISFSYVGYNTVDKKIVLDKDMTMVLELSNSSEVMKALDITAEKEDQNLTNTNGSTVRLKPKDIETIPVLFGEKDILKTVTLLPGVQSAGEGSSGFNVRGGASDQNLILLDEAPVYNASHLLGFFSVFNSDAIKDINLMKGGIPAEYGGRLSSVMDIKMKEGNSKKFSTSGGLGLISSRLLIEAPIVKDKGSFFVSGRRTYADTFLKLSKDSARRESTLYFYDINAKANYSFGEKDRIFLSGYFGQDKFGFGDSFGFEWGNTTGTLRWNHIYSNKLFSNTSIIYSNYDYKITIGGPGFEIASIIKDWTFKQDYQWFANDKHNVKFGFNILTHKISPGGINSIDPDGVIADLNVQDKRSVEGAAYLLDEWKISNRLSANYGLRYSSFYAIGEQDVYSYNENGEIEDTTYYGKNEVFQKYNGLEPRIAVTCMLNEYSSMKASYSRGYQYLHLLSNSTTSSPTDIWMPSSNNIKPQLSDQFTVGYFRNFKDNTYEFSIESYYKPMNNLIDYKTGAEVLLNEFVEGQLAYGIGRAYGTEILIRKNKGKFTGWLGYTLARTEKKFQDINSANWFPAR
ncbi:MAG: TonB-dependent receptor plug domain-containing protein, partial [Flavobacteriales bacterium]|nr:TonB-dependent receptor plug domain-containing protein [Flavobacteriales bacterium]